MKIAEDENAKLIQMISAIGFVENVVVDNISSKRKG